MTFPSLFSIFYPLSYLGATTSFTFGICALRFQVLGGYSGFLSFFWSIRTPMVFSRVKERSSNLPLLIKPYRPISSIRLSSGVSHCRRWISPSVSVLSSYSTIFILVNQMAFYRYFSDAYLSGIHLSALS